jgi:hypothetical protein
MNPLLYATGNPTKFNTAATICGRHDIQLEQLTLDVPDKRTSWHDFCARYNTKTAATK